ncbi:hypothetical protein SK128_013620 [Halocaridina rubra]|uniref:PDZ domain-containing protein n=1 Tax=Halocaridina rubra TaxID=373956 RepID=A0AAN8X295_HALRR
MLIMPDSGGTGPCHQGHVRSYSTVEDTQNVSHDSGAWMECGVPCSEGDIDVSLQSHVLRATQTRGHGQFVTVVAVEKDGIEGERGPEEEEEEEEGKSVSQSSSFSCRQVHQSTTQPVPKAAPRGFVTVVAVGSDTTSVHLDHSGTLTAKLKLHLHPVDNEYDSDEEVEDEDSNYVNQEMIKRERRNRKEPPVVVEESDSPSSVPDQVVVYRLPGERLGLGLKFDGGMGARECVKRLFIQSVAPDSPAARAAVPWGELQPGDQILNIEGCAVSSMTRVQCVSFLKDAAMKITIGVLKGNGILPEFEATPESYGFVRNDIDDDSSRPPPLIVGEMRKRIPPPPLPPRSRPRKSPARPPKDPLPVPPPPSAFQDMEYNSPSLRHHHCRSSHDDAEDRELSLQRWREFVLSRRNHSGDLEELFEDFEFHHPGLWAMRRMEESMDGGDMPPVPAFYHNLVGEEDAMGPCESESDETNSSVSTVIDRLSLSSSTTVSRNSSFNATADASRFDLARALSPFEQLEKELETDNFSELQQSSTPNPVPREETTIAPPIDRSTKPTAAEGVDSEVDMADATSVRKGVPGKMKMRPSIKSFSFTLKGRPFSWQQGKTQAGINGNRAAGRTETFLSLKRPGKRPAPPPPPPRSVDETASRTDTTVTVMSNTSEGEGKGHDVSDDYSDLVEEAAKLDIKAAPINASLTKLPIERTAAVDEENKHSLEHLQLLDSTVDGVNSYIPFEKQDSNTGNISEGNENLEAKEMIEILEGESSVVERDIRSVFKEKENDYVELIPAAESERKQLFNNSDDDNAIKEVSENDFEMPLIESIKKGGNEMEIKAQVHVHESDDNSNETSEALDEAFETLETLEEAKEVNDTNTSMEFDENDSVSEDDGTEGGDESEEEDDADESGDFNESDEDDEGSYILEPALYEDSEDFLSCSSPKISPPILPPRRGLKLPCLIVSEADDMGVYEDLYEGYAAIDDRPTSIPIDRPILMGLERPIMGLGESRGLPSVPEEDSGDQENSEEDAYTLYDDVDSAETRYSDNVDAESNTREILTNKSAEADPEVTTSKHEHAFNNDVQRLTLRHDLGELIRREMNLEDDCTVEVEEEEEVESTVECANEEELLLVMRALRQDQPGDKLRGVYYKRKEIKLMLPV